MLNFLKKHLHFLFSCAIVLMVLRCCWEVGLCPLFVLTPLYGDKMAKKKTFNIDYNRIEQQVWELSEPLAAACGCELIDVEYLKEAGNWYLRLYIDREPPVDHDCCEQVSKQVSAALDRCDPIEQSYYLEVSSPGLNRALKRESDFERYNGREIAVSLYTPWQGAKEYCGILCGLTEDAIIIKQAANTIDVPRELVAKARLAVL